MMRWMLALLLILAMAFTQGSLDDTPATGNGSMHAVLQYSVPNHLDNEGYEMLEGQLRMEFILQAEQLQIGPPAAANGEEVGRIELVDPMASVRYENNYTLQTVQGSDCIRTVYEYAQYTLQPYRPERPTEKIEVLLFRNGSYSVQGIFDSPVEIKVYERCGERVVQDETLRQNHRFEVQGTGTYTPESRTLDGSAQFANTAEFGALSSDAPWQMDWRFELQKTAGGLVEELPAANASTGVSGQPENQGIFEGENRPRLVLLAVAVVIVAGYLYLQKKESI